MVINKAHAMMVGANIPGEGTRYKLCKEAIKIATNNSDCAR